MNFCPALQETERKPEDILYKEHRVTNFELLLKNREERNKLIRKIIPIFLLAIAMCCSLCGHTAFAALDTVTADIGIDENKYNDTTQIHKNIIVGNEEVSYDSSVNYMSLMIRYAGIGDMDSLEAAIIARNAKIVGQGLDYKQITLEDFLDNYEQYAGFSLNTDYLILMKKYCVNGDIAKGKDAESKRNLKIDTLGFNYTKINFNDLYLLSKIITAEAGSHWLSMDWKMMVGEVLLNRVSSPEFPNTIEECVYQKGQYYSRSNRYFANLLPYKDCVDAAARLLSGERIINDGSVVFQANFRQGSGTYLRLYDKRLGYTYLCYSNYPELYES